MAELTWDDLGYELSEGELTCRPVDWKAECVYMFVTVHSKLHIVASAVVFLTFYVLGVHGRMQVLSTCSSLCYSILSSVTFLLFQLQMPELMHLSAGVRRWLVDCLQSVESILNTLALMIREWTFGAAKIWNCHSA